MTTADDNEAPPAAEVLLQTKGKLGNAVLRVHIKRTRACDWVKKPGLSRRRISVKCCLVKCEMTFQRCKPFVSITVNPDNSHVTLRKYSF